MNQILHCDWLPEQARWRHITCSGLPAVSRNIFSLSCPWTHYGTFHVSNKPITYPREWKDSRKGRVKPEMVFLWYHAGNDIHVRAHNLPQGMKKQQEKLPSRRVFLWYHAANDIHARPHNLPQGMKRQQEKLPSRRVFLWYHAANDIHARPHNLPQGMKRQQEKLPSRRVFLWYHAANDIHAPGTAPTDECPITCTHWMHLNAG